MCGELADPSADFRVEENDPSLWGGVVETKGIGLSIMGYRREEIKALGREYSRE